MAEIKIKIEDMPRITNFIKRYKRIQQRQAWRRAARKKGA